MPEDPPIREGLPALTEMPRAAACRAARSRAALAAIGALAAAAAAAAAARSSLTLTSGLPAKGALVGRLFLGVVARWGAGRPLVRAAASESCCISRGLGLWLACFSSILQKQTASTKQ
jgi:hypothetical protein